MADFKDLMGVIDQYAKANYHKSKYRVFIPTPPYTETVHFDPIKESDTYGGWRKWMEECKGCTHKDLKDWYIKLAKTYRQLAYGILAANMKRAEMLHEIGARSIKTPTKNAMELKSQYDYDYEQAHAKMAEEKSKRLANIEDQLAQQKKTLQESKDKTDGKVDGRFNAAKEKATQESAEASIKSLEQEKTDVTKEYEDQEKELSEKHQDQIKDADDEGKRMTDQQEQQAQSYYKMKLQLSAVVSANAPLSSFYSSKGDDYSNISALYGLGLTPDPDELCEAYEIVNRDRGLLDGAQIFTDFTDSKVVGGKVQEAAPEDMGDEVADPWWEFAYRHSQHDPTIQAIKEASEEGTEFVPEDQPEYKAFLSSEYQSKIDKYDSQIKDVDAEIADINRRLAEQLDDSQRAVEEERLKSEEDRKKALQDSKAEVEKDKTDFESKMKEFALDPVKPNPEPEEPPKGVCDENDLIIRPAQDVDVEYQQKYGNRFSYKLRQQSDTDTDYYQYFWFVNDNSMDSVAYRSDISIQRAGLSKNAKINDEGIGKAGVEADPFIKLVNAIPSIKICEFQPLMNIAELINNVTAMFSLGHKAGETAFQALLEGEVKTIGEDFMEFFDLCVNGTAAKNILDKFGYQESEETFGGELPGPDDPEFVGTFKLPYVLYRHALRYTVMNTYEFPFFGQEYLTGNGADGWTDSTFTQRFGGTFGSWGDLAKSFNVNITTRPMWSIDGNGQPYPELQFELNLYNYNLQALVHNFLFVNTIVPNNMWIQRGIFQQGSCLYDVQIPGRLRMFMCKANISVKYAGITRVPPTQFFEEVKKHLNKFEGKYEIHEDAVNSIRVPDAYKVVFSFQSLLPNNFNTYLFNFYNYDKAEDVKLTIADNVKGGGGGISKSFVDALQEGMSETWEQAVKAVKNKNAEFAAKQAQVQTKKDEGKQPTSDDLTTLQSKSRADYNARKEAAAKRVEALDKEIADAATVEGID